MNSDINLYEQECRQLVESWLASTVVGMNLCPFARKPHIEDRVRIVVEQGKDLNDFFSALLAELHRLDKDSPEETETTLLVTPALFEDFGDYLDALDIANSLLESNGWQGVIQVASFHPHYQFEGEDQQAASNFTNRAPFPIFHLIREDSLTDVLAKYPDADRIPRENIEKMEAMSEEELRNTFPWSFENRD